MLNKNILACFSILSTVVFLSNAAFTNANFTSKENKVGNSVNSTQTDVQKEPWISWSKVADVPYRLKELVNDAVWHNNAEHIAERDMLRAEAEKYLKENNLENDYYLPWQSTEEYSELFTSYDDEPDAEATYTKPTKKISNKILQAVHAYEWYAKQVRKLKKELKSIEKENKDTSFLKKKIIIFHKEMKLVQDRLACYIENGNLDLDVSSKSEAWNNKAREVLYLAKKVALTCKQTNKLENLLNDLRSTYKVELAGLMPENNYHALLNDCSKRIKENEESLIPMISEIIKELHELAELAPKEEEKEEKWRNSHYNNNESMRVVGCCKLSSSMKGNSLSNEAEDEDKTEANEIDIIPDDLGLEH